MSKGRIVFRVAQPPDIVFPYLSDLENAPEWVPDLVSVQKVTEGPIGVGTRYAEVVRMGSRMEKADLEVTEYAPDRVFAHSGRGGPSTFSARFELEPDDGGTRITHSYSVSMSGMFKLVAPLATNWIRKNTEAGVENLTRLLESRHGSASQ